MLKPGGRRGSGTVHSSSHLNRAGQAAEAAEEVTAERRRIVDPMQDLFKARQVVLAAASIILDEVNDEEDGLPEFTVKFRFALWTLVEGEESLVRMKEKLQLVSPKTVSPFEHTSELASTGSTPLSHSAWAAAEMDEEDCAVARTLHRHGEREFLKVHACPSLISVGMLDVSGEELPGKSSKFKDAQLDKAGRKAQRDVEQKEEALSRVQTGYRLHFERVLMAVAGATREGHDVEH